MSLIRPPAHAGRFYPADGDECRRMLDSFAMDAVRGRGLGAVVPHAGWVFSGQTAMKGIAAIAGTEPDTVVIFGAVHRHTREAAALYPAGAWQTPLGPVEVDDELGRAVADVRGVGANAAAHDQEHSIEVQLPLIQWWLPDARILPIMVQPVREAADIGRGVATAIGQVGRRVAYLASTDLTHYGPAFGFEPHGRGEEGVRWAKEVNDRRFVELIERRQATAVVAEATAHQNACGSGAVAALLGAMEVVGAGGYEELAHTCSAEVEAGAWGSGGGGRNSVGYHAGVFVTSV